MKYRALKLIAAFTLIVAGMTGIYTLAAAQDQVSPYDPDGPREHKVEPYAKDNIVIRKKNGEELQIVAELAVTPRQLEHGLMYRTQLPDDEGMLFLFNSEKRPVFWMKNTLIPLDVIFIARDGIIHHIHPSAKAQDTTTRIVAKDESLAVLEMAGGAAGRLGIKEGDVVVYPVFRNAGVQHQ